MSGNELLNPYAAPRPLPDPAGKSTGQDARKPATERIADPKLLRFWNSRSGQLARIFACALPAITYAYLWVFWGLAALGPGTWPPGEPLRPGLILNGLPEALFYGLLMASLGDFPLVMAMSFATEKWLLHIGSYFLLFFVAGLFMLSNLGGATAWLLGR